MAKTQTQQLLDYLIQVGSITTYEAFIELGITRLSARIWELKADGWEIGKECLTSKNRFGKTVKYYKYTLT